MDVSKKNNYEIFCDFKKALKDIVFYELVFILQQPLILLNKIFLYTKMIIQIIKKTKNGGWNMALPPPNTRFLVVDDMATMRRIIRSVLNQLGYQNIDEAEDGKVALQKLKQQKYDFVITDWNMPNMTGIELVQAIRKDPAIKHLPVLMVTAEGKKENVIMALKAGVNNYIVKPFTPATLKQKLEQIWNQISKG